MSELPLLGGAVSSPTFLSDEDVARCQSFREVVRLSWANRRVKGMTQRTLGELIGAYPAHVSDYLHGDDKPSRRDLPADRLNAWASVVGNWGVQQWLVRQAKLTLMEEVIARRAA
ncbi:helix-turn-helix transcriptional regulator [Burkholderia multivorans]|nr:helix-turn-helix transcriptional regulator [Burkholderia multivorans]